MNKILSPIGLSLREALYCISPTVCQQSSHITINPWRPSYIYLASRITYHLPLLTYPLMIFCNAIVHVDVYAAIPNSTFLGFIIIFLVPLWYITFRMHLILSCLYYFFRVNVLAY